MKERWLEIYKEVYDDIESDAPVSPALTALVVLCKRVAKLEEENKKIFDLEDKNAKYRKMYVPASDLLDVKREYADLIQLIRELNKVYEIDQCDHILADEVRMILEE